MNIIKEKYKKKYKIKQNEDKPDLKKIDKNIFNNIIEQELKNKKINFPPKTKELLKHITYYDYGRSDLLIKNFFRNLNDKEKEIFLDEIYYFNENEFLNTKILESNFNIMPYSTKKYREYIKAKDVYDLYFKSEKQSIIDKVIKLSLSNIPDDKKQDELINFCFDYLTTLDKLFLYNLSRGKNEDLNDKTNKELLEKYIKHI